MARPIRLLAGAAIFAGCGAPSYPDASSSLAATRAEVTALVLDVADVLRGAGLTVTDLHGRRSVCSSAPRTGVAYAVGGSVTGDDVLLTRLDAALSSLRDDGWTVVTVDRTARRPGATLTRHGHRLLLAQTPRQDGSALTFGAAGACVRFPDDRVPDLSRVDTVPLRAGDRVGPGRALNRARARSSRSSPRRAPPAAADRR